MDISRASAIDRNPVAKTLIALLSNEQVRLGIEESNLYFDFPLYRDDEEGSVVITKVLLISRRRGIVLFGTSEGDDTSTNLLRKDNAELDHVYSHVYSRLLKMRIPLKVNADSRSS